MKKIKKFLASTLLLVVTGCASTLPTTTTAGPLPSVAVSFQFFYDNLSPYGTWVSYPSYGYVWVPRVAGGFRPYFSSGQWVYSDLGWTWASYYDWGWAPFHYGSWLYDPFYGWLWVPGYSWAPAWVTWGNYSDYYCWAPLGPGVSFSVGYYPPIDYWVFVPPRYITVAGWSNTYYVAHQNRVVFSNNTSLNNVRTIKVVDNTGTYNGQRFSAGPRREEFERASNTRVTPVAIRDNNNPGRASISGNNLGMYRPSVNANDRTTAKPSKVAALETMKRSDAQRMEAERKGPSTAPERGATTKSKAPERQATPQQRAPEKQAAPQQRENNVKEQPKMQPKQNAAPQQIEKRSHNAEPKVNQPEARPNAQPAPQNQRRSGAGHGRTGPRREAPKQSAPAPQRMERPEPQPRMAPERKEMPQREMQEPRQEHSPK